MALHSPVLIPELIHAYMSLQARLTRAWKESIIFAPEECNLLFQHAVEGNHASAVERLLKGVDPSAMDNSDIRHRVLDAYFPHHSLSPPQLSSMALQNSPVEIPEIIQMITSHLPLPAKLRAQRVNRTWNRSVAFLPEECNLLFHHAVEGNHPAQVEHLLKGQGVDPSAMDNVNLKYKVRFKKPGEPCTSATEECNI